MSAGRAGVSEGLEVPETAAAARPGRVARLREAQGVPDMPSVEACFLLGGDVVGLVSVVSKDSCVKPGVCALPESQVLNVIAVERRPRGPGT